MSTAHVIRLGTAAAALHSYLREHDDGETSWTSDAASAKAFPTSDAAKRFAARRLGGSWHVAQVDRAGYRRLHLLDEVDPLPEHDAGVDDALASLAPTSTLIPREHGFAIEAHRRAIRASVSTPWTA